MSEFENNAYFWQKVDAAYMSGDYKVVYTKGSKHPHYPELIFPCNYGHVNIGGDNETALRVFKGSKREKVDALVVCANLLEKDLSTIVLVGVSEDEEEAILRFLNSNDFQKTIIVRRGKDIPQWAIAE